MSLLRRPQEDDDDELSVNLMTAEELRESKLAQKKSEASDNGGFASTRRAASLSAPGDTETDVNDEFHSLHELPSNRHYSMTCNWCLLQKAVLALAVIGCIVAVIILLVVEQTKENALIDKGDNPIAPPFDPLLNATAPTAPPF